ncbi:predicted protein [Naegleria gruberi]|uniref:Cytochrome b5 n=1 Tax=Naegleria gruberi TaxID=5762 RepID=D2VUW9_NAEGR|nr:cytochrome b5 [Naegleria gruberi]XP_002672083.1 uncharacterized protein NAEGRDRAFT_72813 [Naegleria gruberi]EFC35480.1 cytochrome b5 [Naegleria gruberi]EFC39339.1 predicted protein [Naegleria gruberi]|eukprot:XP_002668224.1 cytochrome b5 [Naegleria gruberi]
MVRNIALSEVEEHGPNHQDPWIIISGKVVAFGTYKDEHPGGEDVILEWAGKDGTKAFNDAGHGSSAKSDMQKYIVGEFEGASDVAAASSETAPQEGEKKECSIQ